MVFDFLASPSLMELYCVVLPWVAQTMASHMTQANILIG